MNELRQPTIQELAFAHEFAEMQRRAHALMVSKGFWPKDKKTRNVGEQIALIHSELSEGMEGYRQGNPPDDKVPEFNALEAELADAILRIMDLAEGLNLNVGEALVRKHAFNEGRQHKHGKLF